MGLSKTAPIALAFGLKRFHALVNIRNLMNLFGAFVVFVIGFWLVLFSIISRGVTTLSDLDASGIEHDLPGERGAPVEPYILRKMLIAAAGGLILVFVVWIAELAGFFGWLLLLAADIP